MFLRIAYYTGLRLGDLECIASDFITGPGVYSVTENKTGKTKRFVIDADDWRAITKTLPSERKYLLGACARKVLYRELRVITKAAGVRGATKKIRRLAGSMFEADHPGKGHLFLNNGRDVFQRHYNDLRISGDGELRPRAI